MKDIEIAQHQNGFLKVKLPLGSRLHVWSPWNPPVKSYGNEHDHPFDIESECIAGEMINVELDAVEADDGDWREMTAECVSSFDHQKPLVETSKRFHLRERRATVVRRGERYAMQAGVIHRTDAVFAMTLFRKRNQTPEHSRVFSRIRADVSRDPFVSPPPRLLEMSLQLALSAANLTFDDVCERERRLMSDTPASIRTLAMLPRCETPGYHMRAIPRSAHGTAGKVVEEALELADADEQGITLMSLQECADVISAVRGYVRNSGYGVSFEDVLLMSAITERAFASGRRT